MVRLTDRPDMTFDVYRGRRTATQQQREQREDLFRADLFLGGLFIEERIGFSGEQNSLRNSRREENYYLYE